MKRAALLVGASAIGCQNWKRRNFMQQMAFRHPPMRHLNITPEALKIDCLHSELEFSPALTLPLEAEADGLRYQGFCDAVINCGSWVDFSLSLSTVCCNPYVELNFRVRLPLPSPPGVSPPSVQRGYIFVDNSGTRNLSSCCKLKPN